MRQQSILLSFIPGFASILIYIIVEAIFGETAGLIAGLVLGIGEFTVILFRERRVDTFTLVDTILLAIMGAISLALSDPVFFRLKPAISGVILSIMMLLGSLGPHRLFLPYMQEKLGMGELPQAAAGRILSMIAGFGILTLLHAILTAIAALFWSHTAWNFVAGALFWILACIYMILWTVPALIARFITKRHTWKSGAIIKEGTGEMLPIVDAEGRIIGKAPRPLCHSGNSETAVSNREKLLHPVIRLWITDGKGGVWMQKRAETKLVQPGKWDCAVGGHILFGETAETALRRETKEEIGLSDPGVVQPVGKFIWETDLERELVFVFLSTRLDVSSFSPDPSEVSEIRLWKVADLFQEASKPDCSLTPLAVRELTFCFTTLARM
jgi:isopentenyldiphosphate isomerase/intracellular septation protein A